MDKSLRGFVSICFALVGFLVVLFGAILFAYRYSTLDTYNFILYVLAFIVFAAVAYILLLIALILRVYRKKAAGKLEAALIRGNLNLLFPLLIYLSGVFTGNKDGIRRFMVEINNIAVTSHSGTYAPRDILILLPHCLQDSLCVYKVTHDIMNCRRCGRCCIGEMCELSKSMGIDIRVVTGGTVARSLIQKVKPRLVLSVACERDLTSGISDVRSLPVVGVLNDRVNGPCYNTRVDVQTVKDMLQRVLRNKGRQ